MSYLVHPTGWRLYYKLFWKINFYLKEDSYNFHVSNKLVVYYKVLENILNSLDLVLNKRKNLLKLSDFHLLVNKNEFLVLIKVKIYWKSLLSEITLAQNKFARPPQSQDSLYQKVFGKYTNYRERKSQEKQSKRYLKALKKNKAFSNLRKLRGYLPKLIYSSFPLQYAKLLHNRLLFQKDQQNILVPNYLNLIKPKKTLYLFRHFVYFFSFYPLFIFLKTFLQFNFKKAFTSIKLFRLYFLGLNYVTENPFDIQKIVYEMLSTKNYSTTKTLYSIVKILSYYQHTAGLRGFKVLLTGRFSRRDRALYLWKMGGKLPLNTKLADIEFYSWPIQLPYSKCTLKLWLCR